MTKVRESAPDCARARPLAAVGRKRPVRPARTIGKKDARVAAGNILVIKHSALGDFVLATGPMKAIRAAHQGARIILLTTKFYEAWGRECGWFDEVWVDERPGALQIGKILQLRHKLRSGNFARVYDLQTSTRSTSYFYLMQPTKTEWVGVAALGSHPHRNPNRARMHTLDRQRDQLAAAGFADVPPPDLSWLKADINRFNLKPPFALLVPGGSAHRPAKRWPAEYFAELATYLYKNGVTPVLIGAGADAGPVGQIAAACPFAVNLLGQTSFAEIVQLSRLAALSVGNDTGPMHLIAPAGRPAIVLFSHDSDPALCAPRGPNVRILAENHLKDLRVDRVIATIPQEQFLKQPA